MGLDKAMKSQREPRSKRNSHQISDLATASIINNRSEMNEINPPPSKDDPKYTYTDEHFPALHTKGSAQSL